MSAPMKLDFPFLIEDVDRHGNVRLYVRRKGHKKVRIKERPGTEAFTAAYNAAVAGVARTKAKVVKGSFRALCILYYGGDKFRALDGSTQSWERRALDSIAAKHGAKPVRLMEARHVRQIRDEKKDTPAAANQRLKALRSLFGWAVEEEHAGHDPTPGVKSLRYVTKGHHSWTDEEIEQYRGRHPLGTKARLAQDLLRYTTGRREDAVRFGKQHVRNGRIRYRQAKNEHRNPIDMDIPLHPELAKSIGATPTGSMTFLVTQYGRPFTANGFGNKFKDWCRQAGLPHCSAHGLRKATAAKLAEEGATAHEIMGITGHTTLEEVENYTRAAQRGKLATTAMARLK
jgi:integrase/recombinase XerD